MEMHGYYDRRLSARRLRRCYEIAPPRIQRYLRAEIEHVLSHAAPSMRVLELGAGYGRALLPLVGKVASIIGIDTSRESLLDARSAFTGPEAPHLARMDVSALGFGAGVFDLVFAVQNGIAVFGVDAVAVIGEALRVTRAGGILLLSGYSDRIWQDRLDWFRLQAAQGLLGEIDEAATGDGVIVCRDGFRAGTATRDDFTTWTSGLGVTARFVDVDDSSLFCEIRVP